jgi:hypothetical protein
MSRIASPNSFEEDLPPSMITADNMMKGLQVTFRQWANIRGAPTGNLPAILEGPNRGTNAYTNAITLQEFEDTLAQYYNADK